MMFLSRVAAVGEVEAEVDLVVGEAVEVVVVVRGAAYRRGRKAHRLRMRRLGRRMRGSRVRIIGVGDEVARGDSIRMLGVEVVEICG